MVEQYLQYPIHLHGVVIKYLSIETTLNFFATRKLLQVQNLSFSDTHKYIYIYIYIYICHSQSLHGST
jgi:hypothetical protein